MSKGERLRDLFDASANVGRTAPEITDDLLPSIPIGDAAEWMRPAVMSWVRQQMKDRGLIQNPQADGAYTPVQQLALPGLLDFVRHRRKQISDDESSLRDYIEQWLTAHPSCQMSVDEIFTASDAS